MAKNPPPPAPCSPNPTKTTGVRRGRIMLHPQAPAGQPWFWSITVRVPQSTADRGYAASREEAMVAFKAAWERSTA